MAGSLEGKIQSFRDMGLEPVVITVLFDQGGFSTNGWVDQHGLQNVFVSDVAPMFSNVTVPPSNGTNIGTPYLTVIDPSTMEVVFQGNSGTSWPSVVTTTAEANAGN